MDGWLKLIDDLRAARRTDETPYFNDVMNFIKTN